MGKPQFNQNEKRLLNLLTVEKLEELVDFALNSAEMTITYSRQELDEINLNKVDIKAVMLEILTRKSESPFARR